MSDLFPVAMAGKVGGTGGDGGGPVGRGYTVARWVSIVGHPFVLATGLMMLGAVRAEGSVAGLPSALEALALTVVPCGLFVLWKVRTGAWQDIDASQRRQRPVLYCLGLALMLILLVVTERNPRMAYLSRSTVATLVLLAVGLVLNRLLKVSMHATFCAFVGSLALMVSTPYAGVVLAAVPLICWARVRMGRHTVPEVLAGVVLGLTVGLAAVWW